MDRIVAFLLSAFLLSACTYLAPTYSPSADNVRVLRDAGTGSVRVGVFDAEEDANNDSISLRFHSMVSPAGGKFTTYLEGALTSELCAARRIDSQADIEVSGELLKNDVNVWGWCKGTATLKLRVVVRHGGEVRFDKVKCAHISFESSFHGWKAIPRGREAYLELVQNFLSVLYADRDFLSALT